MLHRLETTYRQISHILDPPPHFPIAGLVPCLPCLSHHVAEGSAEIMELQNSALGPYTAVGIGVKYLENHVFLVVLGHEN